MNFITSELKNNVLLITLNRPDPVNYADETGPVSWETVVNHVNQILTNHNK